jgi:hypothetical protein
LYLQLVATAVLGDQVSHQTLSTNGGNPNSKQSTQEGHENERPASEPNTKGKTKEAATAPISIKSIVNTRNI